MYFNGLCSMSTNNELNVCPCGSGLDITECCQKIIDGKTPATTAEALMRSRYSAYVQADEAYLLATWHESTRPELLDLSSSGLVWTGLKVIRCTNGLSGDSRGMVEFIASYQLNGKDGQVHEMSRFVFEQGRWFYLDGDLQQQKVARNAACPCGSGKKYKRCCG